MKRDSAFRSVALLGFILALAGTAWANGEEFFAPAKNGKIDLVYFGRIKDSQTGRSVTDSVYFVLTDKSTGLSFPFTNDKPGHFRSPDVGTAIKEIGEQIDVKGFVIDVNVAGYKRATIARMPRKAAGRDRARCAVGAGRLDRGHGRGTERRRCAVLHADGNHPDRIHRAAGHRKGGANIRPPADHNALTPRGSLIGLPVPTFRS